MTITEKAKQYSSMFETGTRVNGETFVSLKGNVIDGDLQDSIRVAHGDRFPNDWIYGTYADLMQKVTEYELDTVEQLEDVRGEIVDSYVDVYTADLTKWLASDVNNVYYLGEAISNHEAIDGFSALTTAQYLAIDEVMSSVMNLLRE